MFAEDTHILITLRDNKTNFRFVAFGIIMNLKAICKRFFYLEDNEGIQLDKCSEHTSKYTWILDPGHGGLIDGVYQTAGKRSPAFSDGNILYEGVFNRDVVQRIIKLCESHNIDAIDIVNTNNDKPLRARVKEANKIHKVARNCIYISIHANAFGNGKDFNSANGVCTFHHFRSRKGKRLADILQSQLVASTGFRDRGAKANETWANFYVLRKTHMPAILSENGFMTNLSDATLLLTDDMRQKIAEAHFAMILEMEKDDG
jgi:N-acetylmuramoyl-L-alanine amidase